MKKIILLLLAVALTACSTPAPAVVTEQVLPTELPTQTPVIVVQTVVVESTPLPTQIPPTVAPLVVTVVVPATDAPTQAPAPTEVVAGSAFTLDNNLGRGVFVNMSVSSPSLTLRCNPRELTFNITTPNVDILDVEFYYRIVDLKRLYPGEWRSFGKMVPAGNGNFMLTFKGEDVHPDLRIDGSWIDFQFVGLAKSGNVVERSEKIESQIKYTFDCP